jgi:hypothetical protein
VPRPPEDGLDVTLFGYAARVHDNNVICHLRDHAEVGL